MEILEMIQAFVPYEVKIIIYAGTVMYLHLLYKEYKNKKENGKK